MKKKKSNYTNDEINYKQLEDVFSNPVYYKAMKELPLSEKFTLYVYVFKGEYLDKLCDDYKISKNGFIQIKDNGINHFKRNVKKYNSKKHNKRKYQKKGGNYNE